MKRIFICIAALFFAANVKAQNENTTLDTTNYHMLDDVVVSGVRVKKNAPFAMTELSKNELNEFSKTGQELPFLFSRTPGIIAWSENGLGTGTTYMRIRGAGDSRINVTIDGVPLNSPEDQCVFWANMNGYAALLSDVQIRRGVGSSTNGDGAFGGSIVLLTGMPSFKPGVEVTGSYGAFNTFTLGAKGSTGLLWNHVVIDGSFTETKTDGYVHGTSGRSGSFYGGISYNSNKFIIRYKNIGNFENTGQAWNGVVAGNNDYSLMDGCYDDGSWSYNTKTGIHTYEDMYNAGLGQFNNLYEYLVTDENGLFVKDENGNYVTERYRLNNGKYWDKTTDNFWQDHNIISLAWEINNHWATAASLHYTYGYGFYEEFRQNNKLADKFGINEFKADGKSKKSDVVRKKGLSQNTYGFVWYTRYKTEKIELISGLSMQSFDGNHFGYVTYIADEEIANNYLVNGKYQYYDSDARKLDGNVFLRATYKFHENFSVFGDAQYRHVDYKTDGVNDKFVKIDGLFVNQILNVNENYNFFNPKAGISFDMNKHHAFASVAISNREPERNNFTDNGSYPAPKPEQLIDYELGYNYNDRIWSVGANIYYMDYNDQFVQTGEVSDIGEALTTNIKKSYRMGIELQGGVNMTKWLTFEANAAFSQNKIKDFDEVVEDWDNGYQTIHYDNSTLAFSPSVIVNGFITLHHKGFMAQLHTGYVSRQYLDNTENKDRSLPGYSVSNVSFGYSFKPNKVVKEAIFKINFNNIFNKRYAASGWVYSAIAESYNHPNDNRYYQIGFIPMAGFNVMANLTFKF